MRPYFCRDKRVVHGPLLADDANVRAHCLFQQVNYDVQRHVGRVRDVIYRSRQVGVDPAIANKAALLNDAWRALRRSVKATWVVVTAFLIECLSDCNFTRPSTGSVDTA